MTFLLMTVFFIDFEDMSVNETVSISNLFPLSAWLDRKVTASEETLIKNFMLSYQRTVTFQF